MATNIRGNLNVIGQYQNSFIKYTPTGTSQSIDWNVVGNIVCLDLYYASGDVTITLLNGIAGSTYIIKIIQGPINRSLSWIPNLKKYGGNDTLNTNNNVDLLNLFYDGVTYYATAKTSEVIGNILYSCGTSTYGIGDGTTNGSSSPISVLGGRSYSQVVSDSQNFMMLDTNGYAWSWGRNSLYGQMGDGTTVNRSSPVSVLGGRSFKQIHIGFSGYGLEASSGLLWSWGLNTAGQLGDGTNNNASSPISVLGVKSFKQISVNNGSNCLALEASTGYIWGWGANSSGILGDNTTTMRSSPVSWLENRSFKQVMNFGPSGYGIEASTGYVWVCGDNSHGQLGVGTLDNTSSPISVLGARSFKQVISYYDGNYGGQSCYGLEASTGYVWSWGDNAVGKLGDGTNNNASSPVSVLGGISFKQIILPIVYNDQCYALEASTGFVWGWGLNSNGILGDGTVENRSSPVQVLGNISFKYITAIGSSCFGLEASTGYAWSWGNNTSGQLGDGTKNHRSSPVSVLGDRSYNQIGKAYGGGVAFFY